MKNKKVAIIVIIAIIVVAVIVGIIKIYSSYLFNEDGTISNAHTEVIEHLKSINDVEERQKQIEHAVSSNIITTEEANELY
ncbi:MAG: hypothetical protein Q4G05_00320 [Clostridia bacterium]|nr:hypothetical protein [Clostridia bacterium]